MPLILENDAIDNWLMGNGKVMKDQILDICQPFDAQKLKANSVRKLRGKAAFGDVEPFDYTELQFDTELVEVLNN